MPPPVYAIMMCGHTTAEVEARWGDYGDMAKVLLHDVGSNEVWTKYNVCDGIFPTDEEFSSFQGIVITGSKHDAFADDTWIVQLRECMQQQASRGQKLLGLCFGAQLLAVALGGRAVIQYAEADFDAKATTWRLSTGFVFMSPMAGVAPSWKLNIHETHRDQVLELPPGSELLATSKETPLEIWSHGDNVLAVQGHPEFTVDFQHALNEYRVANGSMTVEEKSLAEQSMLEYPVSKENANELATALQAFLKMSSQRSV